MTRKKVKILLLVVIILLIPFLIVLSNFKYKLYDDSFYSEEFTKNKVYEKVADADNIMTDLLLFFKEKKEITELPFTEDERSHLVDVKGVINGFSVFLYICYFLFFIILLILFKLLKVDYKVIFNAIFLGAILTIMTAFVFYLLSLNFSSSFVGFHQIFFPQGNWQFPSDSLLIQISPESLFYDFFYTVIINSLVSAFFLILIWVMVFIYEKLS